MRLKKFLDEDGMSSGGGTVGGVNTVGTPANPGTGGNVGGTGGGTTTKNIAPFYNKIMTTRRRKKKKTKYTNLTDNIIMDICDLASYRIDESIVPSKFFNVIKSVGNKLGFRVSRSDTFFDYIVKGERGIVELYNLLSLYILATASEDKEDLKNEIKHTLKKINMKTLIAFIVKTDKISFGLSSIFRNLLSSVFGVDISTYVKWDNNVGYVISSLDKIEEVLIDMNATDEEMEAFRQFYNIILKTKKEVEMVSKGVR